MAYATSDDTATAPDDYTSTTGTLTFAPGRTMMTISVPTMDDNQQESDERFRMTLRNPSGARLNQATGEGTITDNDGGPTFPELSIGNASVTEGGTARFEVRLNPAANQTVTVAYATSDDTATEPDDYTSTMGTLTFTGGTDGDDHPGADHRRQRTGVRGTLHGDSEQPHRRSHAERRHWRGDHYRQRRCRWWRWR